MLFIHKFNVREDDTNLVIMQISYEVLLKSGIVLHPVCPVIRKDEIDNTPHLREEINNLLDIMLWEKNEFYKIVVYANEHFMEDIDVQSVAGAL